MRIVLVAPSDKPLARRVESVVAVPAAEPLRLCFEAEAENGQLRAAVRMPMREWQHQQVSMHGRQATSGTTALEFFATGLPPGRHQVHFEATLETHEGGLVRESRVAGDVVLVAE